VRRATPLGVQVGRHQGARWSRLEGGPSDSCVIHAVSIGRSPRGAVHGAHRCVVAYGRTVLRSTTEFDARAVELGAIRRFTVEILASSGLGPLVDDALIVVSELVTNVVEHAHTPGLLRITCYPEGARIEVEDGSPNPPVARYPAPERADGHGLSIVDAVAADWGWAARPGGKAVWADLVVGGGQVPSIER
jgi:anti-sigma regulatory factor (Ser/Thr protein kinase)